MKLNKILTTLATSALLTASTISSADDTAIYLSNPNYDADTKPNVLFLLDNSGSMGYGLQDGKSRLKVMQESFDDIMSNSSNINAGIMKLWRRGSESSELTYPVTDVDQPYGEGTTIVKSGVPEILESSDDAYEFLTKNSVSTASDKLIMGGRNASTNSLRSLSSIQSLNSAAGQFEIIERRIDRTVDNKSPFGPDINNSMALTGHSGRPSTSGLYFRNLDLPKDAEIQEAYIEFTSATRDNRTFNMVIYGQQSMNPLPFSSHENLSNRISTEGASTHWRILQNVSPHDQVFWKVGYKYQSPDISSTIQSILDNPNIPWGSGDKLNNLALLLWMPESGRSANKSGLRRVFQFLNSNSSSDNRKAAKIFIKYTTPELEAGDFITGLRFQNIGIPKDSSIVSAKLIFTAAESDSSPVTLKVTAGTPSDRDDPTDLNDAPFSIDDSNISSRTHDELGSVSWTPETWIESPSGDEPPNRYETDVKALIENLVSHTDWCGNDSGTLFLEKESGAGKRVAYSFDGNPVNRPRLVIEYTPNPSGCINEILNTRISQADYDGYENKYGGSLYLNSDEIKFRSSNNTGTETFAAFHYDHFPIKKGAVIQDAWIELTASRDSEDDTLTLRIRAEKTSNSVPLKNQTNNISNRRSILSNIYKDWSVGEPWRKDKVYRSPQIKDLLKDIVDQDDWQAGNGLTLMINSRFAVFKERYAYSYEGNPTFSPRLVVRVASGDIDSSAAYTVKDHLVSLVNKIDDGGGTPIVPRMYNAAKYFKDSFDGKSSPINNACQSNHLVVLTDGEANSNNDWRVHDKIEELIEKDCSSGYYGGEYCGRDIANWLTNTDLSSSVNRDNTVQTHTIAFATSEGSRATNFMAALANEGDGKFYLAKDAQQLSKAFNQIISDIIDNESTFAAPGVAVNSFNRSEHLNKVYYSIFKPSKTDRWDGNLKKYQVLTSPKTSIYDSSRPPLEAIDSETGFFKNTEEDKPLSFWSTSADGSSVSTGGMNDVLATTTENRKIYTFFGSSPAGTAQSITGSSNAISTNNSSITKQLLGLGSSQDSERTAIINWIRDRSKGIGDPLHSTPVLANYKCNGIYDPETPYQCDEKDQVLTLFLGTNDGVFHAVDAKSGKELFAFMPQELLPKAKEWQGNRATDRTLGNGRPYGLDGHVVLWTNDANYNGVIYGGADTLDSNGDGDTTDGLPSDSVNSFNDQDEFVYAYIGMRRGGRNYYALDVTNTANPKMLWYINGGTAPFQQLGQTWSRPEKARIQVGADVKDVLIFTGGYDTNQDSLALYSEDTMGNAIYIVDAKTGSLIWSASGPNTGNHSLTLNKMKYSIPGGVTVWDAEGDGIADQLFFADTGGQVWRLYINNCIAADSDGAASCAAPSLNDVSDLVWAADGDNNGVSDSDDGVIASLGYTSNMPDSLKQENARKFYTRPDVTKIAINGRRKLTVSVGTGTRPDPLGSLNPTLKDRFYLLIAGSSGNPTANGLDANNNSYRDSQSIPNFSTIKSTYSSGSESLSLSNLTPTNDQEYFENQYDSVGGSNNHGWYINMNSKEKIMSDPAIFGGQIYFNTYVPTAINTNSCSAVAGQAYGWEVSLDGAFSEREEIKSNGIVGNSVFLILPKDNTTPPSEGTPTDPPGTPTPPAQENTKCGANSNGVLIVRGTQTDDLPDICVEGSTYWKQIK
ncbi:PilC/PilY family type IV pilus protein [Endozoicomonas sp. OPT23]|uniref:PilC/PilY family type IV pilus protein n=1 Tax=Endozoicomonas sp. OPT23 TaxID=2072845 RepID=UPI001891C14D|nr:PilC/PilY family type IV pilus protein [Endozoicomonas sp. OPT23]